MGKKRSLKISKVAEREIKSKLHEIYCKHCESEDCGICHSFLIDTIDSDYEDIIDCLKLKD